MNLTCTKCDQQFSITAQQLGTRGKCPHCHAAVLLPRSAASDYLYQRGAGSRANYWMLSVICLLVTVFFHAMILVAVAYVPWGRAAGEQEDDAAQLVFIGQLPETILLEDAQEEFDAEELFQQQIDQSVDEIDTEEIVANLLGQLEQPAPQDLSVFPSGGFQSEFELDSLIENNVPAEQAEDFDALIAKLQQNGLDVVITFDSTGSMQGEIDQVKNQIQRLGSVLFDLVEKTRIGICTYRDFGDGYVVDGLPLTDNLAEVVLYLEKIKAGGGGDEPEAVEEGLRYATSQKFRDSARKIVLLFGDAAPRASKRLQCHQLAADFRRSGGVVSTVTCRKSRCLPDFVTIAQSGGGEAFLTENENQIMSQLMVLVFGSRHRSKVIEAFDLLQPKLLQGK